MSKLSSGSGSRSRTWMISPAKDMALFFPAIWGILALLVMYFWFPAPRKVIPWQMLSVVNALHTSLPIAYSIFFMSYVGKARRKQSVLGLGFIFVLLAAMLQISRTHLSVMTVLAPTLFVLASTYHFYRQDLGVCSMYRGIDLSVIEWEKTFERWLICFLAFLGPSIYWLGTGSRYYSVIHLANGPLPMAMQSMIGIKIFGSVCFLGYMLYQFAWKRNFSMRFVYMSGVFIAFLSMLQPELFFLPLLIQYVARILAHDWIEIAFQGKLIREEVREGKSGIWVRLAMYVSAVVGITYFFAYSKSAYSFMTEIQEHGFVDAKLFSNAMESTAFQLWATLYLFASAYHYYIGRYIYDFSIADFRRKLGFGSTT